MKGQLSLEYIIILAAFFSFLALLFPQLERVFYAGIFSTDVKNAENFLHSFENSARLLSVLGEGSEQRISARIFTSWEIYLEGNKLIVLVKSKELGKEKKLSAELNAGISMQKISGTGGISLKLVKGSRGISIINN